MTQDLPTTRLDRLRALTPARVRLDPRAGATPLDAMLDFQLSHARARDAIHRPVDWDAMEEALSPLPTLRLHSRAPDRATYIRRPDLGRRLDDESLSRVDRTAPDLAIVVADGLSGDAVTHHAATMIHTLRAALPDLSLGPVALTEQARVAIGDDVGAAMGAAMVLVLIGERPGLSLHDSLGGYLTWAPKPGTPDSARNCISNIHGHGGLSYDRAADLMRYLIRRARELQLTGVGLKDDRDDTAELPS